MVPTFTYHENANHKPIGLGLQSYIIILVVVSFTGSIRQFHCSHLDFFTKVSANLRMPMFFAVAGLFASKWLSKSWRDLGQGKLALLIWVFLMWQPVVFAYRLLSQWVLDGLSWQYTAEQALRVLASPIRPNGELWFLWTLALFFVIGRLTTKFSPCPGCYRGLSLTHLMSLIGPLYRKSSTTPSAADGTGSSATTSSLQALPYIPNTSEPPSPTSNGTRQHCSLHLVGCISSRCVL